MKVSDSLLAQANSFVESKVICIDNTISTMPGCGCFGCGLGCSGTVGMD